MSMRQPKLSILQNFHKYGLLPIENNESGCLICIDWVDDEDDPEILHEHTAQDTQSSVHCDENILSMLLDI